MSIKPTFPIIRKNAESHDFSADLYYRLVRLSWRRLFILAFFLYLAINLVFGTVYFFFRDGLNPPTLSFAECFFFSVHTFSTVGYGSISPANITVHAVTVVETFFGLVSTALLTGLFFSKFSRPSARFIFSNNILNTKHRGQDALIFRVANVRSNSVMDASVQLTVLYDETTPEGIYYRRLENLDLERGHTPVFSLSLTCVHFVIPGSLSEKLLERIRGQENVEFLVSVRGLDETFGQTIHGMHLYRPGDMRHAGQFEDILEIRSDGARVIDFAKFHLVRDLNNDKK